MVLNLKDVLKTATQQLTQKLHNAKKVNQQKDKKYIKRKKKIFSAINKNQKLELKRNKIYSANPLRNYRVNNNKDKFSHSDLSQIEPDIGSH